MEILALLATQNSCVNKVHVMLCYVMLSYGLCNSYWCAMVYVTGKNKPTTFICNNYSS